MNKEDIKNMLKEIDDITKVHIKFSDKTGIAIEIYIEAGNTVKE